MKCFHFFFYPKSSKSSVHVTPASHLNSAQPHFQWSVAISRTREYSSRVSLCLLERERGHISRRATQPGDLPLLRQAPVSLVENHNREFALGAQDGTLS